MKFGKNAAHGGAERSLVLVVSVLALVLAVAGGTLAWLSANTTPVTNTFTPATVSCEVEETFKNNVKSNVNVNNTSNIDAYLRVKLVTYRVNEDGQHIGGTAAIPGFTPGDGWVEHDGFYYYTKPVAPNTVPENPLIGTLGITLSEYTDVDGGKQVIEVMAEAIQSQPDDAVRQAWGIVPSTLANQSGN